MRPDRGTDAVSDRRVCVCHDHSRAILDAVDQAIIVSGVNGVVSECNTAAAQLLGYRAAEVVGQLPLAVLFDSGEVAVRLRALPFEAAGYPEPGVDALVAAGSSGLAEREWTLVRKDGARVAVTVAWRPLRGALGTLEGCVVLPRAAPERARREEAPSAPRAGWGEPLEASAAPQGCFALADVLRRLEGDLTLLAEVAELFERERVALAADIRRAVEQRDPSGVERSAHRLRSALLNLAAGPAADAALLLEDIGRLGCLPEPRELELLLAEVERLSAALARFRGASR